MIDQIEIKLPEFKRGFHLITHIIEGGLGKLPDKGLLNLFLKHTSAALTLNENADPSVRRDFESIMTRLIKEDEAFYTHTLEGPEDMPAHVKSSIFGASITMPIRNHKIDLGTWQGIYLCEFRNFGGPRKLTATIFT